MFGGPINAAAEADDDKENLEAEDAAGEAPPADGGAGLSDKGKSVAAEPVAEEGGEDAEDGDLQLAWENLETARAIWAKNPEANRAELAGESVCTSLLLLCTLSLHVLLSFSLIRVMLLRFRCVRPARGCGHGKGGIQRRLE